MSRENLRMIVKGCLKRAPINCRFLCVSSPRTLSRLFRFHSKYLSNMEFPHSFDISRHYFLYFLLVHYIQNQPDLCHIVLDMFADDR